MSGTICSCIRAGTLSTSMGPTTPTSSSPSTVIYWVIQDDLQEKLKNMEDKL